MQLQKMGFNLMLVKTYSPVFTCYNMNCLLVNRGISTDFFLDIVGCQVKQIQIILQRKTLLETVFEADIT